MAVQIRPPQAGNVALAIWAVVLEQQPRVLKHGLVLKVDAQRVVRLVKVRLCKALVFLFRVVAQDDVVRLGSAVCARLCLVQGAHADGANVACPVVAGRNGRVLYGRGADEAHVAIAVAVAVNICLFAAWLCWGGWLDCWCFSLVLCRCAAAAAASAAAPSSSPSSRRAIVSASRAPAPSSAPPWRARCSLCIVLSARRSHGGVYAGWWSNVCDCMSNGTCLMVRV